MEKKISQEKQAEPRVVNPMEQLVAAVKKAGESGVDYFLVAQQKGDDNRFAFMCNGNMGDIIALIVAAGIRHPGTRDIVRAAAAYFEKVEQEGVEDID